MSVFQSLIKQELGFEKISYYDVALQRLRCYKDSVYRGVSPNLEAPDFNPFPPTFACCFCPFPNYEHILTLANEDGNIALQNTTKIGEPETQLPGFQAHPNAIFDLSWMPKELKFVTASGDHTACLWDAGEDNFRKIGTFNGHTRSVKTVVFRKDDNAVFATGARDGHIRIWDIRASHGTNPKPDNSIINGHASHAYNSKSRKSIIPNSRSESITGLAFQDDFTLISCAAGDGKIKVWDLRKNYSVHKKDPVAKHTMKYTGGSTLNGFTTFQICPAGIKLYASCTDNTIYCYNISSYNPEPISEFIGYETQNYYIKTCLSPDGKYLLSGSRDVYAYLWRTDKPGLPLVRLSGHSGEVTCVAWCKVGELMLVTCSDDSFHRLWKVGLENFENEERHDLQGRAELVPKPDHSMHKTHRTPTTRKRPLHDQNRTPLSANCRGISPNCEDFILNSDSSQENKPCNLQNKRSLTRISKNKTILSIIEENTELTVKRHHVEIKGARRLFSPDSIKKTIETNNNEPLPSTSRQAEYLESSFSPTSNLPNFVLDGIAPHLHKASPQKNRENDWLTKIRKEKFTKRGKGSVEKVNNVKNNITPARKSSKSLSAELRKTPKSPAGSLLNYLKLDAKRICDKDPPNKDNNS